MDCVGGGLGGAERLSILAMILSANEIASAMADSRAEEGLPSNCGHFLATRMLAAIRMVRFRPSSMAGA